MQYYGRRLYALSGDGVRRRHDPGLQQWWATDKWNRHYYSDGLNVQQAPPVHQPVPDMEFGLHRVARLPRFVALAPDDSQHVIVRNDQLGTVIRGFLNVK